MILFSISSITKRWKYVYKCQPYACIHTHSPRLHPHTPPPPRCTQMRLVKMELSWRENSAKMMLMVGDSLPHDVNYSLNRHRIHWRTELANLRSMVTHGLVFMLTSRNISKCIHIYVLLNISILTFNILNIYLLIKSLQIIRIDFKVREYF